MALVPGLGQLAALAKDLAALINQIKEELSAGASLRHDDLRRRQAAHLLLHCCIREMNTAHECLSVCTLEFKYAVKQDALCPALSRGKQRCEPRMLA